MRTYTHTTVEKLVKIISRFMGDFKTTLTIATIFIHKSLLVVVVLNTRQQKEQKMAASKKRNKITQ
jgi:hypothetical protein